MHFNLFKKSFKKKLLIIACNKILLSLTLPKMFNFIYRHPKYTKFSKARLSHKFHSFSVKNIHWNRKYLKPLWINLLNIKSSVASYTIQILKRITFVAVKAIKARYSIAQSQVGWKFIFIFPIPAPFSSAYIFTCAIYNNKKKQQHLGTFKSM